MRSRIHDHIFYIAEAVICIFSFCLNRKYKDLHAFQMIVILQFQYFRSEISQIFRHQIYTRDLLFERVNHFISRRLNPLAFHSCRTTCRNFPEGVKRPEVIDPDNVKQLAAVSDPVHPELIVVFF